MQNIFLFIILLLAVVGVTVLAANEKKRKEEFDFMASRCSKYVKGTVSQIQTTRDNTFIPLFTINDGERTYDLPYYRPTEKDEFIVGREYDLFVDDEELLIAMTDSDRTYKYDNTGIELRIFVGMFFICVYFIIRLMPTNPYLASALVMFTIGASFYMVADIVQKRDDRKKEQNTYITDATIIDYKINHTDDGNVYFPVYKYTYGGVEYTATSNVSQKNRNEFRRTQTVQISLDPSHPQNSTILILAQRSDKVLKLFRILGMILVLAALAMVASNLFL
ncbi:MAG: DUF3592 domain-containing protein [Erysipelotrichaceae bacterium]|nr:DUF3592 domain-containing protein [Erysipelotrichaceae bacterium]